MTASERKKKTEELLKSLNIPFIEHLPTVEEENEVKIRSASDVARRLLILTYLCYVAEVEDDKKDVVEFLKSDKLWDSVSPDEQTLFQKELSDNEKVNISWRIEAVWLLLWAINKVDRLDIPKVPVNIPDILSILPKLMESTRSFIETATIRSTADILDMSDLMYRLHWATRNDQLNNRQTTDLNPSIVYERHYAVNWLTYYADNWDDITTDT